MAYSRPSSYPYPRNLVDHKGELSPIGVKEHLEQLYKSMLENDSRGEYAKDKDTDIDLKELIVRPEWYGAKGDGVHDDTAAIQAAIDVCLSKTSSYTVLTPQSLGLSGKYLLTSSVNIDRLVDWQISDFRIIGLNKSGGFYADTAIDMFSSTLVNATAPVSEFINFENVYFEGSSETLGAYVLDGDKFLRMKFTNCRFHRINLLTTDIYIQSIYLQKCTIRNVQGIFLNCLRAYDVSFEGNLIELTGTVFKDTAGGTLAFRFINNLCEGTSATPIITYGLLGSSIVGNYFEWNTGPDIDFSPSRPDIIFHHSGVFLAGNHFIHSATDSFSAINWGDHVGSASSIGNRSSGVRLHDLSGIGSAKFSSIGDCETDAGRNFMSELFVGSPSAATELLTNGGFDSDTNGWDAVGCTLASVSGGNSGQCLEITRTGEAGQHAVQTVSGLVIGAEYTLSGWVKSGTSGAETFFLFCYQNPGAGDVHYVTGPTSSTWVKHSVTFVATDTSYDFFLIKYSATPGTMLFDTISLQRNIYSAAEKIDVGGNINISGIYKVDNVQIGQKDISGLAITDSPTFNSINLTWGLSAGKIIFRNGGIGLYQNRCLYSEDFGTGWGNGLFGNWIMPTVTTNSAVSPFGDATADKLARSHATSCSAGSNQISVSAGGEYVGSVWLKAGTETDAILSFNMGLNGVLVEQDSGVTLCSLTTEWVRYNVTATVPDSGVNQIELSIGFWSGTLGEYFYAWGAQVELGTSPSVYASTGDTAVAAGDGLIINSDGPHIFGGPLDTTAYKVAGVQVVGARAAAQADLKADYATPDLDTEAEIIAAINATNVGFNTLLAKLRVHGTIAT